MSGFYSYNRIDETHAQYRMVIGERSNGKTYGALLKAVTNYIENGKQTAYIRRYKEDFVGKRGNTLFAAIVSDDWVKRLTKGEWNNIVYYSSAWYLAYTEEGQKTIKDETPFCYGFSINDMEHDKSTSYPNITLVVFDEFLSRGFYLSNEFVLFENVLSTIIRQRNDVVIYMLGNTVNKMSPYFSEMGITNIRDMKPGDLDVYSYGESELKVAIEYADPIDKDIKQSNVYFAFDNPSLQMITNGGWEFDLYPHITFKYRPKDIKFTYFIDFNGFMLQCEIVRTEDGYITCIHRKTTPIKNKKDLVFTNKVDDSRYHIKRITQPTNDIAKTCFQFLKTEKVFFQDNSVGEDLRNYLQWCQKTEFLHG